MITSKLFSEPRCRLSLLGLGGGGGGLSASATSGAKGGDLGGITVNNSSGLSTNTMLIFGAVALGAFLLFALLHHGHR